MAGGDRADKADFLRAREQQRDFCAAAAMPVEPVHCRQGGDDAGEVVARVGVQQAVRDARRIAGVESPAAEIAHRRNGG